MLFKFGNKSTLFLNELRLDNYPTLSIIVPIKNEPVDLLQGLIDNLNEVEWDKKKLEIVIVSDDTEDYFEYIKNNLKIPDNLNVKLLRRTIKEGYKSGALTYGYHHSTGELILTLDVDARLKKYELIKAYKKMVSSNCDAVTMKWVGYYNNRKSKVAKALTVLTLFTSESIQKGREKLGFHVFPVGCGTLFKRSSIEDVGPWDSRLIQDDLEIGARFLAANKKICASDAMVSVIVPEDFFSYYIQQTRWAMGESEVLKNRFNEIFNSNNSILKRIEVFFFLTQYLPISTTFLGSLAVTVLIIFKQAYNLSMIAFAIWIIFNLIYSTYYLQLARELGYTTKEALMSLGRVTAYTESLSPFILYSSILGLIRRNKTYKVTPKSNKVTYQSVIAIVLIFGLIFLLGSIMAYLLFRYYLLSFWLLIYSSGYLYTAIMYRNEL
ncbi:MAG: glycosyltransferase family 2 protein [Sulfolobaceae archaeon]|nr:glycosyltransferase family 2 protein [Sulfolobaceae archaeon]